LPAKPGKTNALKHGLYAQQYLSLNVLGCRTSAVDDVTFEIAAKRIVIARLHVLLRKTEDAETYAKLSNSLSLAETALTGLIRFVPPGTGDYSPLDDALAKALLDEPFYAD
jgi:hypothetical protein